MTEANIKAMHKEITEFMAQLAKKYNFKTAKSRITYSDSEFTLSFKANMVDQTTGKKVIDKVIVQRAARALWNAGNTKIDASSLFEKDYDFDGIGRGRVVDVRSRAPKYPFVVESASDGKKYAVSASSVIRSVKFGDRF